MFGESMELKRLKKIEELLANGHGDLYKKVQQLKREKEDLEKKIERHTFEVEMIKRKHDLAIVEAKNDLRKEMQKALIESDIKRTEAVAKLETFIAMDTKDERKHIQSMLEKAIEALGKEKVILRD